MAQRAQKKAARAMEIEKREEDIPANKISSKITNQSVEGSGIQKSFTLDFTEVASDWREESRTNKRFNKW